MQTRITLTTLSTRAKPLTTCSISALYTAADGRKMLVPLKDDPKVEWLGLRPMRAGGSNVVPDNRIMSKTQAFQMTGSKPDLILEVRLAKSGGGYGDIARFIYLRAATECAVGVVNFRVLDSVVSVLEGPLQFMDTAQSMERLGRLYKAANEFRPAEDSARLGVTLAGIAASAPMVSRRTIGEDGEETTVKMRRLPRQLGL